MVWTLDWGPVVLGRLEVWTLDWGPSGMDIRLGT